MILCIRLKWKLLKAEKFRKKLIAMFTAMIGTVPIYDAIGFYDKELKDIKAEDFKKTCRRWSGLCYYSCRIK